MIANSTVLPSGSSLPSDRDVRKACSMLLAPEDVSGFSVAVKADVSTNQIGIAVLKKLFSRSCGRGLSEWIIHDDRNAPMVVLPKEFEPPAYSFHGREILLSLTDEDQYAGALAVVPAPQSVLVGVGIDLANTRDFASEHHSERLFRGLFSISELSYLHRLPRQDRPAAAAMLFSAKEAAIKSLAPLVRISDIHSPGLVKVPLFSNIDIAFCGEVKAVTFLDRAAEDIQRLGVERVECVCIPHQQYSLSVAKCIKA